MGGMVPALILLGPALLYALQRFTGESENFSGRDIIWPYFLDAIERRPLFGFGLGAGKLIVDPEDPTIKLLGSNAAHNEYLRLAVDAGVVGCAAIFLSIILWIWNGTRRARPADQLVLRCALVAALLHSGFDNTLIASTAVMQFSFFAAALARARIEADQPDGGRHGRSSRLPPRLRLGACRVASGRARRRSVAPAPAPVPASASVPAPAEASGPRRPRGARAAARPRPRQGRRHPARGARPHRRPRPAAGRGMVRAVPVCGIPLPHAVLPVPQRHGGGAERAARGRARRLAARAARPGGAAAGPLLRPRPASSSRPSSARCSSCTWTTGPRGCGAGCATCSGPPGRAPP